MDSGPSELGKARIALACNFSLIPISARLPTQLTGTPSSAYKGILPAQVLNKPKTGWTVPIGYWLTKNMDSKITKFYQKRLKEKSGLNIITASQKAGKALLPSWIINDWMKTYEIQSNNDI